MNFSQLKSDIPMPPINRQQFFRILALIVLPNALFLGLAWWTNTARPLINVDYCLAIAFMLLPYKICRMVGAIVLVAALLFDALMFTVQIFPFMDLAAIRYLLPFLSIAPTRYLLLILLLFLCMCLVIWSMLRLSQKQSLLYSLSAMTLITLFSAYTLDFKYATFNGGILGRNNYYLGHSQAYLFGQLNQNGFSDFMNTAPKLTQSPPQQQRAINQLSNPIPPKILFIISESWGTPRTIEAKQVMLEKIHQQKNHLQFIDDGNFDFNGATVAGELRELCHLSIENGYALRTVDQHQFSNCLPNQLQQQGYKTIALHGTSGRLYDRYDWWAKAGFQESLFGENLMQLKHCTAFKGVCDSELNNIIAQKFSENKDNKLFFYWLTLTSHAPYSTNDINGPNRFNCAFFKMDTDGDICRNAQLQTQFLDDLAKLIGRPEMSGVEVIVVGDHMPPLFGAEDIHPHLRWQSVSWLHFKIK